MKKKNPMTFNIENLRKWLYLYIGNYNSSRQIVKDMAQFFNLKISDFYDGMEWAWRIIYDRLQMLRSMHIVIFNPKNQSQRQKQQIWKMYIQNDFDMNPLYRALSRVSGQPYAINI